MSDPIVSGRFCRIHDGRPFAATVRVRVERRSGSPGVSLDLTGSGVSRQGDVESPSGPCEAWRQAAREGAAFALRAVGASDAQVTIVSIEGRSATDTTAATVAAAAADAVHQAFGVAPTRERDLRLAALVANSWAAPDRVPNLDAEVDGLDSELHLWTRPGVLAGSVGGPGRPPAQRPGDPSANRFALGLAGLALLSALQGAWFAERLGGVEDLGACLASALALVAVVTGFVARSVRSATAIATVVFGSSLLGLWVGEREARNAFHTCFAEGPEVLAALHEWKDATGEFPERLTELGIRLPCRRWLRGTLLRYRRADGGFYLSFSDWLVHHAADQTSVGFDGSK
jgi:hypothetical protein